MKELLTEEYLLKLIDEYFYSMLCTKRGFVNVNKYVKKPLKLYRRKDYIDFLVQKRKDIESFYTYMENLKYSGDYPMDYGKILELGTGALDSLAIIAPKDEYDISVMSPYYYGTGFDEVNAFDGEVVNYSIRSKDDEDIYCKYVLRSSKNDEKLDNYDTFLYMNPVDITKVIELFLMGDKYKKGVISGIITNQYDKLVDNKLIVYQFMQKLLEECEIPVETDEVNSGGTIIRTIKYI